MPKRNFKWVHIYWHSSNLCYLRLTPPNLEMEKLGFPHGIALAQTFTFLADAEAYAEHIDAFFNALEESIKSEQCTSHSSND